MRPHKYALPLLYPRLRRRIYAPQNNGCKAHILPAIQVICGICGAQCMYSAPYRCARIPAAAHIAARTYAFLRQRRILYEGARTRRTRRLFFIFLHFLQKYFLIKKSGRIKKFRPKFFTKKIPKKFPQKIAEIFLFYKIMQITPPLPSLAILVMAFLSLERVSS